MSDSKPPADSKPPRWKSEVVRSETSSNDDAKFAIDTGRAEASKVDPAQLAAGERADADGRKATPAKKPVPKQAILIGIAAGAVLGSLLAYGVLQFVWWRREVNDDARYAAEAEAERLSKQAASHDPMRRYSVEQGKR